MRLGTLELDVNFPIKIRVLGVAQSKATGRAMIASVARQALTANLQTTIIVVALGRSTTRACAGNADQAILVHIANMLTALRALGMARPKAMAAACARMALMQKPIAPSAISTLLLLGRAATNCATRVCQKCWVLHFLLVISPRAQSMGLRRRPD